MHSYHYVGEPALISPSALQIFRVQLGGELFVSGSYRLGVQRKGGDIDIACVVPRYDLGLL